jgi:hypothetical protein
VDAVRSAQAANSPASRRCADRIADLLAALGLAAGADRVEELVVVGDGADHSVPGVQRLLREGAAETAADTGDEERLAHEELLRSVDGAGAADSGGPSV